MTAVIGLVPTARFADDRVHGTLLCCSKHRISRTRARSDIDAVAVETAKHNAKLNGVDDKCLITLDDLVSESDAVGDIVVANITADVLCVLAKDIKKHVKEKTKLILSGILRERADDVVNAYLPLGYKIINSESKGEWVALVMEKL